MNEPPGDGDSHNGFNFSRHMDRMAVEKFQSSEGYVSPEDYRRLDKICEMSEVMDAVLLWCWKPIWDRGKFRARGFGSACTRFVAMTTMLKPDLFEGLSYEQIGNKMSVTKQQISQAAKGFESEFGVKFRRSKVSKTNKNSESAKIAWRKRNGNK